MSHARQLVLVRIGSWTPIPAWQNRGLTLRVAVVHYDTDDSQAFGDVVRALAKGIERQGHDVTVVDAKTEGGRSLTPFQYICIGVAAPSVLAKSVPPELGGFLRSAGQVSGKRSYAFVGKKGWRKGRVLASLMKTMEAEGMYLKRSDVLSQAAEAEAIGTRLHVEPHAG
ncbi:MAG: glycogen/starch synthase [Spirochaetales bacterium]|nr:glycogen/starch synthase [Spirochaetales bacterium]